MAKRQMKSKAVALGLTLVAASALTACSSEDSDYQAFCVDPQTEVRVDDDACDEDDDRYYDGTNGGFFWFFMSPGNTAPAVGKKYSPSTGVYKPASGKSWTKGGVPASGGKVTRGGFGSGFGKSGG